MLRKNKKKMAIAALLSLAIMLAVTGCAGDAPPVAEEPVTETGRELPGEELDEETGAESGDIEEPEDESGEICAEDAGYEADDAETGESAGESAAIPQSAGTAPEITAIAFNRTGDLTLYVGTQNRRPATTTPEGGAVIYTSSNPNVATVDAAGNVVCIAAGTTVITASSGNISASYTLTVVAPAALQAPQSQAIQSQAPAPQSGGASGTGVFAGVSVTVSDRATTAVTSGMPGRNAAVYNFLAADGRVLGSISRDAYMQIMERHGVWRNYLLTPPASTDDWAVWFADEFNRFRSVGENAREVANAENAESMRHEVVQLVNQERARIGLSRVEADTNLMQAAQVRARELAEHYSHNRPDGRSFSTAATEAGVQGWAAGGENINRGPNSAEVAMSRWMGSQGHRDNILHEMNTAIGVGLYIDANGQHFWVQLFQWGSW